MTSHLWPTLVVTTILLATPAAADPPPRVDALGDLLPPGAVARIGSVRLLHAAPVQQLAFTPDGKSLLATGGPEGIRQWDPTTGKELRRLPVWLQPGSAYHLSADGRSLTGLENGRSPRTWELASGRVLRHWSSGLNQASRMAFSADGRIAALSWPGRHVRVYDATTEKELASLGGNPALVQPGDVVFALGAFALSPDGKLLALGGREAVPNREGVDLVRLWDIAAGKDLVRIDKLAGEIRALVFSPDGKTFLLSNGGQVSLYEVATGKAIRSYQGRFGAGPQSFAFSPEGRFLALGDGDTLRVQETRTGQEVWHRRAQHYGITAIAYSSDGKALATGGTNLRVKVWDAATGKELLPSRGHQHTITRLVLSPDGKRLASHGLDQTIRLWDVASGKEIRQHAVPSVFPDTEYLGGLSGSIAFGDAGKTLQAAWVTGLVMRWDVASGKELGQYRIELGRSDSPAFSATGRLLASMGSDGIVRVRDAATGKQLHSFQTGASDVAMALLGLGDVGSLAFSPDERMLATPGQDVESALPAGIPVQLASPGLPRSYIQVWELAAGKPRRALRAARDTSAVQGQLIGSRLQIIEGILVDEGFSAVRFSPDGRTLAQGSEGLVLWDLASGRVQRRLGPVPGVTAVAYSPDGKYLAAGSLESTLLLWNAHTSAELHHSREHSGTVAAVAFSPDGTRLYSSGTDGTILVWDIAALVGQETAKPVPLSPERLAELWQTLAGEDAAAAFQAIRVLTAAPQQSVPFLKTHLRPAAGKAEEVRQVRAVEVLEHAATAEARQLLDELARGKPEARLTQEARAAAARLTRRPVLMP